MGCRVRRIRSLASAGRQYENNIKAMKLTSLTQYTGIVLKYASPVNCNRRLLITTFAYDSFH